MRTHPALLLIVAMTALASACLAQTAAFCNIQSIDAQQLSNGVQISIKADGVLDWMPENNDWGMIYGGGARQKVSIVFTNAKSQVGKTFIDVSKYPVSYLQLAVPQSAKEGVGVNLVVAMYEPASIRFAKSTDQQSVIITVNSERNTAARATSNGSAAAGAAAAGGMDVSMKAGLLSIDSTKAKLLALLAAVSVTAKADMVIDDSVKDRDVSVSLDGMAVDDAVAGLAASCGLAASKKDGIWTICDGTPVDLATYRLSGTESYRMKYIKAQTASGLLPTFLYSFLHVNEAQNAVVVTAPGQMLDKIRSDFGKVDVAPPQIMIEALAVEVASTSDLTASLATAFRNDRMTAGTNSATGDITYSTIGTLPTDFQALLKALVSDGKAKVRANPRMAAVNGQAADIFIGQTKFIKVEVTSYGGKQERIQGVDVGVKLEVRPWTGGNGEITVTLKPEVSNISEQERETGLPVLSTRRAETTVRVKDGETIMIGGLVQKQEYQTRTKVPILGDIPILGIPFRSRKTSTVDSELVIFVTPRLLTDRGRLKDEAEEAKVRRLLK